MTKPITQTLEKITPDVAKRMLEHNVGNRKLRRSRIERYAREMKNGQWLDTRDPIRFDWNGRLADGQHRLHGVIEWGGSLPMLVVRGLDPAAFKVMDQGLGRSGADALGADVKDGRAKSALVRMYLCWTMDGDPRDRRDIEVISRLDVAEYHDENEVAVMAATSMGTNLYRQPGGNKTAWGAFALRAWEINANGADEFLNDMHIGAGLSQGSPILAMRNWASNKRHATTAGYTLALIIKSWNGWLVGAKRTNMMFREDESFPVMLARRSNKKSES